MDSTNHQKKLISRSVAPLFRSPDLLTEQVSQAVYGTEVREVGEDGVWRLIVTPDGYEGWIAASSMVNLPTGWAAPWVEVEDLWVNFRVKNDYRLAAVTQVMIGTRLPLVGQAEGWVEVLAPEGTPLWIEERRVRKVTRQPVRSQSRRAVCATARRFLGVPYLWGGCSPWGLDCSGFVQLVMRLHGVLLPRDAYLQIQQGELTERPEGGDLVFFGPEEHPEKVTHVGMLLDERRFIHAAGSDRVRINQLSDEPYIRQIRGVRRCLPR